jgi:endogenous inhibitor of DNA gyrase (YacG/DUF329 family)
LRASQPRGRRERFWDLIGIIQVRCADCDTRFTENLWQIGNWRYARCPRCYRLDLGTWSESHYIVPWNTRLLLALGAKRYRCEVCRCNFASFRRLKERFSFHRYRKQRMEDSSAE